MFSGRESSAQGRTLVETRKATMVYTPGSFPRSVNEGRRDLRKGIYGSWQCRNQVNFDPSLDFIFIFGPSVSCVLEVVIILVETKKIFGFFYILFSFFNFFLVFCVSVFLFFIFQLISFQNN